MNKKGFVVKEMIFLSVVLAIVFGIAITKVTFAYEDITKEEEIENEKEHVLKIAAEYYAKKHSDEMEEETFIFGSDLIDEGFLFDTDKEKENAKIKITKKDGQFSAEVVE